MKISLVIPTLKQGGAERVMSVLANTWSKQGHDVHLILLTNKDNINFDLLDNVTIYELGFSNNKNSIRWFYGIKTLIRLRKIIQRIKPRFVISFMTKYNLICIISTIFLKTKVFVSDRNNPNLEIPTLISILRKYLYKYADGVIAQTNEAKDRLLLNTRNKNILVVPNPLKELIKPEEIIREKIILNVGRLVPEKGQKYLIEAFVDLKKFNWKLVILGEGPLRTDLEKQIEILNLTDFVEMPGATKEIDHWLYKSSIFAFPSVSEGFPNSLVEAMAAGLPCISFDCDVGPRDIIINNKNGFLVEPKNTKQFAEKIKTLIEDKSLRESFSKEALIIRKTLDSKEIANRILNFCK